MAEGYVIGHTELYTMTAKFPSSEISHQLEHSVIDMTNELGRILNGLVASIEGRKLKQPASLTPNT